jgi:hypothetical protein
MPRAESFTLDGGWPSAQLIALSALALVAAVCDQFWRPEGISNIPCRIAA